MSCNTARPGRQHPSFLVSIPIGFSNELQRLCSRTLCRAGYVSIPIGFSNELQRDHHVRAGLRVPVSIPIGFSNELQRSTSPHSSPGTPRFQSLSGFPMSCNAASGPITAMYAAEFQSLSGFPMSCNLVMVSLLRSPPWCFNPYRVFQ